MSQKGVVVDLDGTFLSVNTFERYYFFLLKLSVIRFKIKQTVSLVSLLTARRLKMVTHAHFKKRVLNISNQITTERDAHAFVKEVLVHVNRRVISLFKNYKINGYYTCMATAAPALYAEIIGEQFGFDAVCATESKINGNGAVWKENIRENKLLQVRDYLGKKGVSINVVITDHHDDLPLLEKSIELNYLVDPSVKTRNLLANKRVKYSVV